MNLKVFYPIISFVLLLLTTGSIMPLLISTDKLPVEIIVLSLGVLLFILFLIFNYFKKGYQIMDDEVKDGKTFWYVKDFRINKYIIVGDSSYSNEEFTINYNNKENLDLFFLLNKDKICFTEEEALELLKKDTDKIVDEINK